MISPVSVVYSEVDKLIQSLVMSNNHICLHDQYYVTHGYLLVSSLSLEFSMKTLS